MPLILKWRINQRHLLLNLGNNRLIILSMWFSFFRFGQESLIQISVIIPKNWTKNNKRVSTMQSEKKKKKSFKVSMSWFVGSLRNLCPTWCVMQVSVAVKLLRKYFKSLAFWNIVSVNIKHHQRSNKRVNQNKHNNCHHDYVFTSYETTNVRSSYKKIPEQSKQFEVFRMMLYLIFHCC